MGNKVTFKLDMTNLGNIAATGLTITLQFDPGLEHAIPRKNRIEAPIAVLQPGQTTSTDVELPSRRQASSV